MKYDEDNKNLLSP